MWNDVETTEDLLNFKVIADTAAQLILNNNNDPISIGISGSWGVGKSSLVKMIGESVKIKNDNKNYIFIEFNAWLYQGYDDARMALLQKVADKILEEAEKREAYLDQAKGFIKRINWLRVGKMVAPAATGLMTGGWVAGPVGAFLGTLSGILNQGKLPTQEEFSEIKNNYAQIAPDLKMLLNKKEEKSIPKEIEEFRSSFQELLENLELNLIVLVDDLDRCLPDTAISTLEAMRLLLFIPQTAFIIAADEHMIRNAVRSHFNTIELTDSLVTSYFDKLIQIPLRVPRLSTNEVKAYLILLLADFACRQDKISEEEKKHGHDAIIDIIKKAWAGGLTRSAIEKAYGNAASKIAIYIDLADQLANIMTTAEQIAGNPRLIKRFLNNLIIRESVAKAQGMSVSFAELVKIQLFERCSKSAAFEYLVKQVAESEDGKPKFLQELETKISKSEKYDSPHESWNNSFVEAWLGLNPPLADIDLRPLLYLSRDKALSFASFDELSSEGRELLIALSEVKGVIIKPVVEQIKSIDSVEADKILTRLKRKARNNQWDYDILIQALHIPKAYPELSTSFVAMLDEMPANKRPISLIPLIRDDTWAEDVLTRWRNDEKSPSRIKKTIKNTKR